MRVKISAPTSILKICTRFTYMVTYLVFITLFLSLFFLLSLLPLTIGRLEVFRCDRVRILRLGTECLPRKKAEAFFVKFFFLELQN